MTGGGTVITGTRVMRSTFSVTDPRKRRSKPLLPCVPKHEHVGRQLLGKKHNFFRGVTLSHDDLDGLPGLCK